LVFSAKESLYKCLYPQVQRYFGFEAARVCAVDLARGTFVVRLEKDVHPFRRAQAQWTGAFAREQDLLMTVLVVPKGV
jgi:4'-phosphopantetheinyl transferase EntD